MYGYEFVTPANKFMNTMAGVFHAHPRMTGVVFALHTACLLYTSPSPRDS